VAGERKPIRLMTAGFCAVATVGAIASKPEATRKSRLRTFVNLSPYSDFPEV
jgi:hypothetical protein